MADIYPVSFYQPVRVLPAQNGNILVVGNTSDENPNGAIRIWLYAEGDCDVSLTVLGRSPRISTADYSAPWIPVPYRRVTIDNVASDYAMVSAVVRGTSSILVPTCGASVGLLVAITTGAATMRCVPVQGAATP